MSFGKLFAAGKNLVGGRHGSRYRVDRLMHLPTFISPKNPFVRPAKSEPAFSEFPPCQAADTGTRVATTSKPTPTTPNATRASVPLIYLRRLGALMVRLNPAAWFARRRAAGKPVIPRFGKPVVQEELRLERIRVQRNDLSDADLEVVPAGNAAQRNLPGGVAWSQLAQRVFGAGQQ